MEAIVHLQYSPIEDEAKKYPHENYPVKSVQTSQKKEKQKASFTSVILNGIVIETHI